MSVRTAEARWEGTLREGKGRTKGQSGAFDVPLSFRTRFEEEPGTNPEELIGAAHAGCYSMALSADLGRAGFTPDYINTTASVHFGPLDGKPTVSKIALDVEACNLGRSGCRATVPGRRRPPARRTRARRTRRP